MGYKISWVAVRDVEPSDVLKFFPLSYSGERSEHSDAGSIVAAELPNNWFLIHFNDFMPPQLNVDAYAELSKLGWVVGCHVHEGIMASHTTSFHAGVCLWSVTHSSDKGLDHIESNGCPPKLFNSILSRIENAHREDAYGGVDYFFELPVELASSLVGYRYDHSLKLNDSEPFYVLEHSVKRNTSYQSKYSRKKKLVSSYAKSGQEKI
ncbi:hypothetical protein J7384_18795 [Endozoicomonas sp. G2_1]|uniref:hypothetical protein n=1 Tax=Endozoicomonas sp. G2_1 TaxID=2821091 RepID=UPI001ADAED43|nr:hypothetical protein [Endozoicomonas sp. G2_1]MBO9492417.1 hypothetical protein [Endozoicomonas sp. G2_1]